MFISANGKTYDLVFSDEFEVAGRSFADGSDPRWTSINKNDYTNAALQVSSSYTFLISSSHGL